MSGVVKIAKNILDTIVVLLVRAGGELCAFGNSIGEIGATGNHSVDKFPYSSTVVEAIVLSEVSLMSRVRITSRFEERRDELFVGRERCRRFDIPC